MNSSDPGEIPFASADEAMACIREHDRHAVLLSRYSAAFLRTVEQDELRRRGIGQLTIGDLSKDELAASILELRFPHISQARTVIAGHQQETQ